MFIIIVFRLDSDSFSVSSTVSPKRPVTGCNSSLEGGWIFHLQLIKSILFFVNWISLCFYHLFYSTNMLFRILFLLQYPISF